MPVIIKKKTPHQSQSSDSESLKKAKDDFFNKKAQEAQAFLDKIGFNGLPGYPLKEEK